VNNLKDFVENNCDAILEILKDVITPSDKRLLEIGSGQGEYSTFCAPHFPWMEWYPSDNQQNMQSMKLWFGNCKIPTIQKPQRIEVGKDELPKLKFEVIFTAHSLHLMHWKECKSLMKMFGGRLREGARVIMIGPFKYGGHFSSERDAELDSTLKLKDPMTGIRSFEDINNVMIKNGFELTLDADLPANNHLLIFTRLKHK
jgi:hypothetical protein